MKKIMLSLLSYTPGDYVRPLPGGRSSSPQLQGVTDMERNCEFHFHARLCS